ncbi:hypothetical protein PG997_007126 [Apiospora hydei]|uniref:Uncharacterized protein n=1 Tax=Apiospora hydei TaxID=1337664 RepID=A0ABR1WQQ1_9PEZI
MDASHGHPELFPGEDYDTYELNSTLARRNAISNARDQDHQVIVIHIDKNAVAMCGWCKKDGHEVKECAGPPAEDGFIHAYSIHNSDTHTLSSCRIAQAWDLVSKHSHLVAQRRQLPPMLYRESWEKIAWDFLATQNASSGKVGLPFTAEFSKQIAQEKFEAYDYNSPSTTPLGPEERTMSTANFLEWYRFIRFGSGDAASEGTHTADLALDNDDLADPNWPVFDTSFII